MNRDTVRKRFLSPLALVSLASDSFPCVGEEVVLQLDAAEDVSRISALEFAVARHHGVVGCTLEVDGAFGIPWGGVAAEVLDIERSAHGEVRARLRSVCYVRILKADSSCRDHEFRVALSREVSDWSAEEEAQGIEHIRGKVAALESLYKRCSDLQKRSGLVSAGSFCLKPLSRRVEDMRQTLVKSSGALAATLIPREAIGPVVTSHALVATLSALMRTKLLCEPLSLLPRLEALEGSLTKIESILDRHIETRRKSEEGGLANRNGEIKRNYLEATRDYGLLSKQEAGLLPVVRRESVFSEAEVEELLAVAAESVNRCVGGYHREHPNGPWSTWYLHTGGWLRRRLPAIYDRLVEVITEVDRNHWHLLENAPCAERLGTPVPRCIELHTVGPGGALPHPDHVDVGSLWTLDVMLSRPGEDFDGGEFRTLEADGDLKAHEFGFGDAVAFVSHKRHCVAPVTRGRRQVMVIEFWHGEERDCAHRCCQRWGSCRAQLGCEQIQEFYAATVSGNGGAPARDSPIYAMVLAKARDLSGDTCEVGLDDIDVCVQILMQEMRTPTNLTKGGARFDATQKLEDDGRGWTWLSVGEQGGILEVSKSVPYGKTPLLVAKADDVESVFDDLNWEIVSARLAGSHAMLEGMDVVPGA
ncbi:unnamed protein product [Prorocentrum cordatum]|uniref:Fe2OG dioxygenase domain-containing protein n=1 Tax=Prorocentrum cordatum TaxID=2364126 RepID=A0ABN9VNV8_9DINO|nr:unnamed protein product [Polarella glacialis]